MTTTSRRTGHPPSPSASDRQSRSQGCPSHKIRVVEERGRECEERGTKLGDGRCCRCWKGLESDGELAQDKLTRARPPVEPPSSTLPPSSESSTRHDIQHQSPGPVNALHIRLADMRVLGHRQENEADRADMVSNGKHGRVTQKRGVATERGYHEKKREGEEDVDSRVKSRQRTRSTAVATPDRPPGYVV